MLTLLKESESELKCYKTEECIFAIKAYNEVNPHNLPKKECFSCVLDQLPEWQ